jgi:DNA-binding MarR family transcriptional regulator
MIRACYGLRVKKDVEGERGPTSFLLAQVGAQAAARYAERVARLGLSPAHSGLLRLIAHNAGISQKALGEKLSILPSRVVVLVDELQELGLVERRDGAEDRRVYELHLSEKGRQALADVGRAARAHDDAFLAPLDESERQKLRAILGKLADHQGLTPGVHPGYRRVSKRDAE